MAVDILFQSPTVITGDESAEPFVADVLVSGGLIAKIGAPGSIDAPSTARRIEAKGHVLSPGFIDMHAHSDLYLLSHPDHEAKITQGCTVRDPKLPDVTPRKSTPTERDAALRRSLPSQWGVYSSNQSSLAILLRVEMQ